MSLYCSWCGKQFKWLEIVLWGDSPCDKCYLEMCNLLNPNRE